MVFLWVLLELLLARGRTEIEFPAVVYTRILGVVLDNIHFADWIYRHKTHFSFIVEALLPKNLPTTLTWQLPNLFARSPDKRCRIVNLRAG